MGDFHTEIKTKARKEHKCECCRCSILKGEDYYRVAGNWSYGFYFYKLCATCSEKIMPLYLKQNEEARWDGVDVSSMLWDMDGNKEMLELVQLLPNKNERIENLINNWVEQINEWEERRKQYEQRKQERQGGVATIS